MRAPGKQDKPALSSLLTDHRKVGCQCTGTAHDGTAGPCGSICTACTQCPLPMPTGNEGHTRCTTRQHRQPSEKGQAEGHAPTQLHHQLIAAACRAAAGKPARKPAESITAHTALLIKHCCIQATSTRQPLRPWRTVYRPPQRAHRLCWRRFEPGVLLLVCCGYRQPAHKTPPQLTRFQLPASQRMWHARTHRSPSSTSSQLIYNSSRRSHRHQRKPSKVQGLPAGPSPSPFSYSTVTPFLSFSKSASLQPSSQCTARAASRGLL